MSNVSVESFKRGTAKAKARKERPMKWIEMRGYGICYSVYYLLEERIGQTNGIVSEWE